VENNLLESARSIRSFLHAPFGGILISGDYYSSVGAKVQIPKHVARGNRRDQQLFRIPAARIATKCRVRRAGDYWLPRAVNFMIAAIGAVIVGASASIASP
jgi:hypothetical protein